ncbi:PAS domain S-box protein [Stenotrophomonas sp. 169]|uniref:two-component system sensor histidine kinase NtrB n=1 Tax=Stenotrophomonas sp. 169 TaxID=2770322 RepID=UPI00166234E1|nr:PAS domain-containing sensor histidine kinase [Stenotrophomonas sp. 169]MBD8634258.1 PAS domain S-box protein [Stenotrophomonas sp. CFBP 13725]MBD8694851.1 PAS domain S-box protein [Stenotrophomonas sp. CFBP 13718]QNR95996.1 PAS domain S-box protein [Stenotrophomonas sp. 169]
MTVVSCTTFGTRPPTQILHTIASSFTGLRGLQRSLVVNAVTKLTSQTESSQQLKLLIESVTDHALYLLDTDGLVCSWNPGAERIKGYPADDVIGTHFSRFHCPTDRDAGEPGRSLDIAAREGRYAGEGWRLRSDGSRFRASVVIEPVFESEVLVGFVKVTRDITESYQAQVLLRDAQRALASTQQFEKVSQLSRGLAHEFNNLLTTIHNALDLIALRCDKDDTTERLIGNAQAAADRGALLTRQLLAFGAGQTLVRERVSTADWLQPALAALQQRCLAKHTLQLQVTRVLPDVLLDPSQLEAALFNLVGNACDAMPEGGHICIIGDLERRLDPQADTPTYRDFVAIRVQDEGHGMAPDIAARASEPFFTTKDIGQGSGLGLSQVFGFITQCGGFVDVSSTEGGGTTVSLLLPALEVPAND